MNLSFSSEDLLKTVITDASNGVTLYQTETHNIANPATEISKFAPETGSRSPEPLARVYWETFTFASINIVYRGRRMLASNFLRRRGLINLKRTFVAADGREYAWKVDRFFNFELYDDAKNLIAKSNNRKYGTSSSKAQYLNIEIISSDLSILDDIIVTFIIGFHLEKCRQLGLVHGVPYDNK